MSTAVLILGMHRSGTSAMAGALAKLGVALGDRLMDGAEDNPDGYFEHRDIVAAHDELALREGRTWDDPRPAAPDLQGDAVRSALAAVVRKLVVRDFGDAPLWAVKDPRLCRFLPAWLDLLDGQGVDARCLLVLRSPAEVAASLAKRNDFSNEKSAALWLDHVLEAHRGSRGRRRTRARFDELLDDAPATLGRCADELGVRWPTGPGSVIDDLDAFLRPELRHHHDSPWGPSRGPLAELANEVWDRLRAHDDWPHPATLDTWYRAYAERFDSVTPLTLEHAAQVAERVSRERAWMHETALASLEERIVEAISDLTEEVAAHSRELVKQGEAISDLAEEVAAHSQELVKQGEAIAALDAQPEEHGRGRVLDRWRRLVRRDD